MHTGQGWQQALSIVSDSVARIFECASALHFGNIILIRDACKTCRSTISERYSLTERLDILHEVEMSKVLVDRGEKRADQGPIYHYVKMWTVPILLKVRSLSQEGNAIRFCSED